MNPDDIVKLIKGGETLTVEFKGGKKRQVSDRKIFEKDTD